MARFHGPDEVEAQYRQWCEAHGEDFSEDELTAWIQEWDALDADDIEAAQEYEDKPWEV